MAALYKLLVKMANHLQGTVAFPEMFSPVKGVLAKVFVRFGVWRDGIGPFGTLALMITVLP